MKTIARLSLLATASGLVVKRDAPSSIHLDSVSYGAGSCTKTGTGTISSDGSSIVVSVKDAPFALSIAPSLQDNVPYNSTSSASFFICLHLTYPSAWQYGIVLDDLQGYASLDKGISAVETMSASFSGSAAKVVNGAVWTGPYSGNFKNHDVLEEKDVVWNPCSENRDAEGSALKLEINVKLNSQVMTAEGVWQLYDAWDKTLGLSWKKC